MTMTNNSEWQTDKALKKHACMIAYTSFKGRHRGWWVREYHSTIAMENHLKKKLGWENKTSYGETGPFRTKEEAREYALYSVLP